MDMTSSRLKQRQGLEPTQLRIRHIQGIQARNLTFTQNANQKTLASVLHHQSTLQQYGIYDNHYSHSIVSSSSNYNNNLYSLSHTRSITPSIELPSGASSPTKSYFRSPWKSYQGIQRARGPGSDAGSVSASESGRGASSVIKEPIARLSAGLKATVFSSGYTADSGNISEPGSGSGIGDVPSKTKSKDRYRLSVDKLGFRDSQRKSQRQKQQQLQSNIDQAQADHPPIEWTMTPSSPPTVPSLQSSESISQLSRRNHGKDSHPISREQSPFSESEAELNSRLPSFVIQSKGKTSPVLLDTYFTLHDPDNDTIIYTSETVPTSNNPKYSPLEEHKFVDPSMRRLSHVVIRVWAGQCESDYVVLLEWRIDLCCLKFIGKELQDLPTSLPNNTILFEFTNGFYAAPDEDDATEHPHTSQLDPSSGAIVYGAAPSYTYDSVMRLNNLHECITDTKRSRDEIKHTIEMALKKESAPLIMQKRRGECTERLWHLQRQVGHELNELEAAQAKAAALRKEHAERRKVLSDSKERGQTQEMYLEENVIKLAQSKESLFNTLTEYSIKRRELIATLFTIFPITESEMDPGLLMIRNIPLPNSVYVGLDDDSISIAIGFTCQLITMLAHYLSVPLRYPVTPMGCRAFIYDPVSILVGPREFPLYGKGQERYRFEYGVFLLNKNVEQLLNSQGLNLIDLRQTLPNLRYLMETLLTSSPTQSTLYRSKVIGRSRQERREQERLNDLFVISVEQREFEQILHPNPKLDLNEGAGKGRGVHSRMPSNSKTGSGSERSSLLQREYDPIEGDYMLILDNASLRSPKSQKEPVNDDVHDIERTEKQSDEALTVPIKAQSQSLSGIPSGLRHGYTPGSSIGGTDNEDEDTNGDRYREGNRNPAFRDWASEALDSSSSSRIEFASDESEGKSDMPGNRIHIDAELQDNETYYGRRINTSYPPNHLAQTAGNDIGSAHGPPNTESAQGSDIETDINDPVSPPPPASVAITLLKDGYKSDSNETDSVLIERKIDGGSQLKKNDIVDQFSDKGSTTQDRPNSPPQVSLKDKSPDLGNHGRRINHQSNADGDQLSSKKRQQTIQTSPALAIAPSLGASS